MIYDVFRNENRAGGHCDHVGQVAADDAEQALTEAQARFECDTVHHLTVSPAEVDDAQ